MSEAENLTNELFHLVAHALSCDIESLHLKSGVGKHYNWDSLQHVAVIIALEEKYGITIDENNIHELHNLESIVNFIINKYSL